MKQLTLKNIKKQTLYSLLFTFSGFSFSSFGDTQDTMVITATSTALSVQDAPANVAIVTRQDIALRNAVDLQDALRGVPGIQMAGIGMNRQAISIHGMPTSYTLILIDGKRINNTDAIAHANFDLNSVPIDSVERIEVIKGPMSALYGSEALGGVINIITRKHQQTWQGDLSLQGGLTDGLSTTRNNKIGGYLSGPIVDDTLYLTISGDRYYRANILSKDNPQLSDFQGMKSDNANISLSYKPTEQQTIDIQYSDSTDKINRNTSRASRPPLPVQYYQVNEKIRRKGYSLSHQGNWDWGQTTVNLYRNTLAHDLRYSHNVPVGNPHQHITDTIFDTHISAPLFDRHLVTLGNEWRKEELESQGFTMGKNSVIKNAFFIQDQIDLTDDYRWSLLVGNRFDYQNSFGWNNSPRVYLVHHVNDNWTIKGGVGRGFKSPTLKQSSADYTATGGAGRFTIQGNPDLQPEQSTTYELNTNVDIDDLHFNVGIFRNNIRNLIQTRCVRQCGVGGAELRTYQNVDKAKIRGIEAGFDVDLPYQFNWGITYTYIDAKNQLTHQPLAGRSNHMANMKLQWRYDDMLTLVLRGEYIGSQIVDGTTVRYHVPAYTLWHAGFNVDVTKNITAQFNLHNLTNQRLADKSEHYNYEELGRTITAGLTIKF